jgi:phenylalanyl-tRNA synthetase beta chain
MKISLEWIREYVDFDGGPEALGELLTHVGFPVEELEQVGDDWMLDVEVTSNRPDCLGHIGIAREVSAVTGAKLRIPEISFSATDKKISGLTSITNETGDLCKRYTGRLIEGVNIGPSPDWMVRRLATIGQRSINNVVDITNYVLMEIGQPLHTFDLDQLREKRLLVRPAKKGETLETIDHSQIKLTEKMLVIADAQGPVALAGIMGGANSEVTESTDSILLESAWFDPLAVRSASRSLTLASESSFRFERNVSQVQVDWASRRAAALLAELAGGQVANGVIDLWENQPMQEKVSLRLSRLKNLLGIAIETDRVKTILDRLGFQPQLQQDVITCRVPVWRSDIDKEVDLIEEVIRIHGYNHIPTEKMITISVQREDAFQRVKGHVIDTLNGCGFYETIGVSFIEDKYWPLFTEDGFNPLRVKDLSRRANNALRPTVLPTLLKVRKHNQDMGNGRCDVYELSAVHNPDESIELGLASDGNFRELRGVIEALIKRLNRQGQLSFESDTLLWAKPGAGTRISVDGQLIGHAGVATDLIQQTYDLDQPVCLAKLRFDALMQLEENAAIQIDPLLRFPGITRDLSLVLDESVTWADLEAAINGQNIEQLRSINFVAIYRGKGIETGKKSLTLSLHFRHQDGTLTHEQVDKYQDKVMAALAGQYQAQLRQ